MIKKLIFLVDYVVRKKIFFPLLVFSFLGAQEVIEIKLIDGKVIRGEFVGTYMGYIHLLNGDNLSHFDCNDVQTATKFGYVNIFEYDCSKNTVTKEMLFPPQLNPMTGKWEVFIPDFLNPEEIRESTKKREKLNSDFISKQKTIDKPNVNKTTLNRNLKQRNNDNKLVGKSSYSSSERVVFNFTDKLTEQELRKIIKKEVRKELKRVLPYEIKKHKETKQNSLFQNVLIGCGAWFLIMLMLS